MILVFSGPSGVGKTTFANELEKMSFKKAVSFTTRPIRDSEKHGVDYNFISKAEFEEKIKNGDLLEYVEKFSHYYGSCARFVDSCLMDGSKVVMCLTKEGFLAAKKRWKKKVFGVFLMPPSLETLEQRLKDRNSPDFALRMAELFSQSLKEASLYDYIQSPKSLEDTLDDILCVINSFKSL
jgi:guanylate kinase